MAIDGSLSTKMKAFQIKWASIQAGRIRLTPKSSEEDKATANTISRQNRDDSLAEFDEKFSAGDLAQIRKYIYDELQPIVLPGNPQALDGTLPVREVDGDVLETFYFWRTYV